MSIHLSGKAGSSSSSSHCESVSCSVTHPWECKMLFVRDDKSLLLLICRAPPTSPASFSPPVHPTPKLISPCIIPNNGQLNISRVCLACEWICHLERNTSTQRWQNNNVCVRFIRSSPPAGILIEVSLSLSLSLVKLHLRNGTFTHVAASANVYMYSKRSRISPWTKLTFLLPNSINFLISSHFLPESQNNLISSHRNPRVYTTTAPFIVRLGSRRP